MAVPDRLDTALQNAYAREVRRGVLLSIAALWILLALDIPNIVIQVFALGPDPWFGFRVATSLAEIVVLFAVGAANYVLAARSPRPLRWSALFVAISLVTFLQNSGFFFLPPSLVGHYPRFLSVRTQDVSSLVILLAMTALPLSRALILWTCATGIAVYVTAIVATVVADPASYVLLGPFHGPDALAEVMRPWAFVPDLLALELVALAIFAVLLAAAIGRGESFVERYVRAESDRSLLSRFFSPGVVQEILRAGGRIAPMRRDVAVLFVGASRVELDDPEALTRLGAYYARVEAIVFAHDGVVDRLAGGPVMATFGALSDDPLAAQKSVDCARALRNAGLTERPGLGLHFGSATCGEAGTPSRRIFSVVGDVVNAAQRVCEMARRLDGALLATGALVGRLGETPDLVRFGEERLRGREGTVELWRLGA